MNFIKKIEEMLFKRRYYGHIISLGYNCEVSFQFFLKYHFVESSLFAWANLVNCEVLINALKDLDKFTSKGFKKNTPMYIDVATGIFFHGKEVDGDSEEDIIYELTERIKYLRDKFKITAVDGKKNLYVFKYPSHKFSSTKALKDILSLHAVLNTLVKNDFDLLIISEYGNVINIPNRINNIFVRYVSFYTPENRVTSKPYDKKHYSKIFSTFRPLFRLTKKKKFKFEDTKDE